MAFEHFQVASGPTTGSGEAQPGFLINDGATPIGTGFATISSGLAGLENTANDPEWAPYDRMVQVPTLNSGADQPFGIFVWQQNKIFDQNPVGGAWRAVHTVTDQENLLDYGVKTGLIQVFGEDSRPYLVGFYPATAANTVGVVVYDVLAETWSSQTFDVGDKFSNCTYAVEHDGKAYMASEQNIYVYNPAGDTLIRVPNTAALGTDWRDKVFVLSGRVFVASVAGSSMRIYEYFGSFKLHSTVSSARSGVEAEFGVLMSRDAAYLHFFNTGHEIQCFEVEASLDPMSSITVTDRSEAVWGSPVPLVTESRVTCRQEYEDDPKSDRGGTMVLQTAFIAGKTRYQSAWNTFRWNGPTTFRTGIATDGGETTYTSSPKGDGIHIYHGATAVDGTEVPIYTLEDLGNGLLSVRFGVFGATGSPATQALRLLFGTEDDSPAGIADTQGTIISISQGSLDGQGRAHSVPLTPNSGLQGSAYYTLTWDRLADGVDVTKRHWIKLETQNSGIDFS